MKSKIFYIICIVCIIPIFLRANITIEDSYKKALNYESKIKSYEYQTKAKKEIIRESKSRLYPKINLQLLGTHRNYRLNYSNTKRFEQYYTLSLSGDLPIYHPEYYNDIEQSRLKYKFSKLYLEQSKQKLAFNVTDAFMSIIRAKNSLMVANAYLEANRVRLEQITKKFKKRLSNKMDYLDAKVVYEQSKIKVNIEKHNLELAKFKFKILTGIKNPSIPTIDMEKIDISKLKINYDKKKLLSTNLEAKKSKINIDLTKKQIKASTYGYYPKVDLSASFSKYDSLNRVSDYKNESRVMLSIKIPLYQGGYVDSQIERYRYLLKASNEDLKDINRKNMSQYEEFSIKLNKAKENIKLYKESIKSASLYLYAVKKGYENGLKDLIDVEDAKTKLFDTKFKLIDSVYNYVKYYTSLLDLFGVYDFDKIKNIDNILFK